MNEIGNLPPQAIEAEQSVLGAIMLDNDAIDDIADVVSPEHFYKAAHQKIYSAMLDLSEKGEPIDIVILNNYLKERKILLEVGDTEYIMYLSSTIPTAANAIHYAKIVKGKAMLRTVISTCAELSGDAYNHTEDVEAIESFIDSAEGALAGLSVNMGERNLVPVLDVLKSVMATTQLAAENKITATGIPTGIERLDSITGGLIDGHLIIVGARPSMGKTALAMNIAYNVASGCDKSVAIFSLEMTQEQLATRLLSSAARVNSRKIKEGNLYEFEWVNLTRAVGEVSEAKIFIDDTPAISVRQVRARCRKLRKEHGLDMVVVDYLQLMGGGSKYNQNREGEISSISRGLKALAKEMNVPVLALSQLNRSLEQRPNKRPRLSDLRESGAIEQDADIIMFLYRDIVYRKDADALAAEIIVGKNRDGGTGTAPARFIKEYTLFDDMPEEQTYEGGDYYDD